VTAARFAKKVAAVAFDDTESISSVFIYDISSKQSVTVNLTNTMPTSGAIALSDDGTRLAFLGFEIEYLNPNQTRLYVWDVTAAQPKLLIKYVGGSSCEHITFSKNGQFIAFKTDTNVVVYDLSQNKVRWQANLGYVDYELAISEDGSRLVVGFTSLAMYEWDSGKQVYVQKWTTSIPNQYVCGADIANGKLAVGWTSYENLQPTVAYFDNIQSSTPKYVFNYGKSANLQDLVAQIVMVEDGTFFAVATWGNDTDINPTVRVFSGSQSNPVYTLATSGSAFSVDISKDPVTKGLHLVAGTKSVHANIQGRGGTFYYVELSDAGFVPTKMNKQQIPIH
jgi:hypothetical protein